MSALAEELEQTALHDEKAMSQEPSPNSGGVPEAGGLTDSNSLPEKFRGKSLDEVVSMYTNLESQSGRQANELGELRRITDEILKQGVVPQMNQQHAPPESEEVTDDDFLENPAQAVQKVVERALRPLTQAQESLNANMTVERLQKEHPDLQEIVSSEDFQQWVVASPVRAGIWERAAQGDFAYANEIFSMWKQVNRPAPEPVSEQAPAAPAPTVNQADLAAATTISKGTNTEAVGGKPIYSRQALIRLRQTDPEKYFANHDEIIAAYQEGRVKA
jgi:hypothetical protein